MDDGFFDIIKLLSVFAAGVGKRNKPTQLNCH